MYIGWATAMPSTQVCWIQKLEPLHLNLQMISMKVIDKCMQESNHLLCLFALPAFRKLGLDCANWPDPVYRDLLRCENQIFFCYINLLYFDIICFYPILEFGLASFLCYQFVLTKVSIPWVNFLSLAFPRPIIGSFSFERKNWSRRIFCFVFSCFWFQKWLKSVCDCSGRVLVMRRGCWHYSSIRCIILCSGRVSLLILFDWMIWLYFISSLSPSLVFPDWLANFSAH